MLASDLKLTSSRREVADAELVLRAREGDADAEATLYRRHAPNLLRTTTRLLRSRQEAEDVLHDTFVFALESLDDLREPARVGAWLLRIAVRLTHRRFRRRRLLAMLGLSRPWNEEDTLESFAMRANAEARVELARIDTALTEVKPKERIAWMLRRVEGQSLAEVAATCECSLATAKRRIAAADAVVSKRTGKDLSDA